MLRDAEICVSFKSTPYEQPVSICKKIGQPYVLCFEPIRTSDDPIMSFIAGEMPQKDAEIRAKMRKRFAKDFAESIAKQLIEIMEKNDTFNGYKIVKENFNE